MISLCSCPSIQSRQGVCPEINGAFTGAVSTSMLDSVGVKWALAGHSERRVIFGETDEYINGQCKKLIEQGMAVMLCIGESEAEYEQDLAVSQVSSGPLLLFPFSWPIYIISQNFFAATSSLQSFFRGPSAPCS